MSKTRIIALFWVLWMVLPLVGQEAVATQLRMKKAKYLLLNYRDITIAEVAEKCGYTLMTNFTRAFARYYGIKPSEVRLQKPDTEITPPTRRAA